MISVVIPVYNTAPFLSECLFGSSKRNNVENENPDESLQEDALRMSADPQGSL